MLKCDAEQPTIPCTQFFLLTGRIDKLVALKLRYHKQIYRVDIKNGILVTAIYHLIKQFFHPISE